MIKRERVRYLLDLIITICINSMFILRKSAKNWNKFASYSVMPNKIAKSWQLDSTPGWFIDNLTDDDISIEHIKKFKYSIFNLSKSIGNKIIIYNTASEAVVVLSDIEFKQIYTFLNDNKICLAADVLKSLSQLGIIVDDEDDEMFKIQYIINSSIYNTSKTKSFVLYPTTECNARCFYCFAHDDIIRGKKMTIKTADNVLNFIYNQVCEGDEVVFRWFGGEPLFAADVIDYIIYHFKNYFDGSIPFHSIITTNASLITEDLLENAISNWNLRKLLIPIDGHKENHNKRKNYKLSIAEDYYQSLQNVVRWSLERGVYVICRLNLDKKNIVDFDSILKDLKQFSEYSNFYIHPTTLHVPEFMQDRLNESFFKPEDFNSLYFEMFSKLLNDGFYKSISDIIPKRQLSVCEARLNNHYLVSSDGKLYACEQENHIPQNAIGDCRSGIRHNENIKKWINSKIPIECTNCAYMPICLGGCEYYRSRNDGLVTPCTRVKFYIDALMDLIYKHLPKNVVDDTTI